MARNLIDPKLIDEYGALDALIAPVRPSMHRAEMLRSYFRAHYDRDNPEEFFTAKGIHFDVILGAKANSRSVDAPALIKAIGLKAYAKIALPTLTALEAAVTADIIEQCVLEERAGPRSLTLLHKRP